MTIAAGRRCCPRSGHCCSLGALPASGAAPAPSAGADLGAVDRRAACAAARCPANRCCRPELFSLLPLPRRRLAAALLTGWPAPPGQPVPARRARRRDPIQGVAARARARRCHRGRRRCCSPPLSRPCGRRSRPACSAPARVAGAMRAPCSPRWLISVLAVTGTLLPALVGGRCGIATAPWLSALLRLLPSGWGPLAVEAGRPMEPAGTLVPLLRAAPGRRVAVIWCGRPRWAAACRAGRRARRAPAATHPGRRSFAGHECDRCRRGEGVAACGCVTRSGLTCLLIALIVGTATCVLPRRHVRHRGVVSVRRRADRGDRRGVCLQPRWQRRQQPVTDGRWPPTRPAPTSRSPTGLADRGLPRRRSVHAGAHRR